MKPGAHFPALPGALLFLAGILLELALSLGVAWGEVEASVYSIQSQAAGLEMECPLMLSPTESGVVSATITNTLDETASPNLTADISRPGGDQRLSQTLSLAPHETQTIQWPVNASDTIYGRLILVNILQSRYKGLQSGELSARQGACGILLLSLLGLKGVETFRLLFAAGLALLLTGTGLWLRAHPELDEQNRSLAHAGLVLACLSTLGLLASLPRWWGWILILDSIALILMIVILTELVLFPRPGKP